MDWFDQELNIFHQFYDNIFANRPFGELNTNCNMVRELKKGFLKIEFVLQTKIVGFVYFCGEVSKSKH